MGTHNPPSQTGARQDDGDDEGDDEDEEDDEG